MTKDYCPKCGRCIENPNGKNHCVVHLEIDKPISREKATEKQLEFLKNKISMLNDENIQIAREELQETEYRDPQLNKADERIKQRIKNT